MPYNPFNKNIGELTIDDINKLIINKVAEGYFIEYKSGFPENYKIGHSIASFANTYGGWYFVGIETNDHNIANSICGFSLEKTPKPIDKMREIIKSHIDPIPAFFTQLITLEEKKAVLIVFVPEEQETPFVSQNGRFYRRIADSSSPVYEKDRYSIDRLIDRGRDISGKFRDFCKDERVFNDYDKQAPWLKIYLFPYPQGMIEKFELPSDKLAQGEIIGTFTY